MGHPEEVDVIVAGGGPAGCVVAGRLAYADPNLKVMLIEGESTMLLLLHATLTCMQVVPTTGTTLGSTVPVSTFATCRGTECTSSTCYIVTMY